MINFEVSGILKNLEFGCTLSPEVLFHPHENNIGLEVKSQQQKSPLDWNQFRKIR